MIAEAFDLSGKVAFVTGAGRGLGRVFARALAEAGADIVCATITPENATDAAADIESTGRKALAIRTDVTDPDSVQNAVDAALERFGRIDVLVNNAGIVVWCEAEKVSLEDWHKVIDVNLHGAFYCSQAVGRVMIERGGGVIVNIASMSGQIVNLPQGQAAYNSSKAALVHLTRSLAVEWAKYNIRVNALSPGYMGTPMSKPHFENPETGGLWIERTPMGRPGRPEELGPVVVFMASEASSYMTGANVVVDGGYTLV